MSGRSVASDVYECGGVYFSPGSRVVNYRGETKVLSGFALEVVRSLFAAVRQHPVAPPETIGIGGYRFDPSNGELSGGAAAPVYFSASESVLFTILARHLNRMVPVRMLTAGLTSLHGGAEMFLDLDTDMTRRVDVFICVMRRKLRTHGVRIEIGTKYRFGRGMFLPGSMPDAEGDGA